MSSSVSDMPLRSSGIRRSLPAATAKRQKEILEAALTLFHEQGYAATSIEDVATAVGILKGSLYHYIDSKEDLLYRFVEQVHEGGRGIMADVEGHSDLTALERIEEYVRAQVLYNARNHRRMSVYYQDRARLGSSRSAEDRRFQRAQQRFVMKLIEEAVAAGEVPADIDMRLAANCVHAVVIWPHAWYRPGGPTPPKALAEFCGRFVIGGITGGGPLAPPTAVGAVVLSTS